jgi:hypothetical protein
MYKIPRKFQESSKKIRRTFRNLGKQSSFFSRRKDIHYKNNISIDRQDKENNEMDTKKDNKENSARDKRRIALSEVRSVHPVISLQENHTYLQKWLTAVEYLLGGYYLYDDWKELYIDLYNLASTSTIFDGTRELIVLGRMLILIIVTHISKRSITLTDCMQMCNIPSDLYFTCINHLFRFFRFMFDFPLHDSNEFNFSAKFSPSGSNSNIMFGSHKTTPNNLLAFKSIRNDDNGELNYTAIVEIITHFYVLKSHGPQKNLSELRGVFASTNHVWLILTRYSYEFDNFFLKSETSISICQVFKQLCQAVKKLHDLGIAHRDIKSNNIMFDKNWNAVLIDYGLCSLSNSCNRQTFPVCTVTTRPPEQLFHNSTHETFEFDGKKIDIWSLGCVFSALVNNGHYIFPGITEKSLKESVPRILNNFKLYLSPNMREKLGVNGIALLIRLLCTDPEKRPSIDNVLNDPYFQNGNISA